MESEKDRNIRHLWYFGVQFYFLQRHTEKYIESAPIGATSEEAANYVEPYIEKLSEFRKNIDATRITLRQRGVEVPRSWCNPPVCLAAKRSDDGTRLELAEDVVAKWQAIQDEVNAIIEELSYSPENVSRQSTVDPATEASHSPDFRSVFWYGESYSFTSNQAACVQVLWSAWEAGAPDVGGETLLEAADASTQRIDIVFRGNKAWGVMIVGYKKSGGRKGTYRLARPEATNQPKQKRKPQKSVGARK